MRNKAMLGILAAIAGVALPVSAPAGLRFRADGNACSTWKGHTKFTAYSSLGLKIVDGSSEAVTCAVPTGASLVDLGDGGHPIDSVGVRLRQEGASATVATQLIVHDNNSDSACTCGQTSAVINAGSYSSRSMSFDCGSCSYAADWALTVSVNRDGQPGDTLVKLISVYDE
jgi:hypothetical protein